MIPVAFLASTYKFYFKNLIALFVQGARVLRKINLNLCGPKIFKKRHIGSWLETICYFICQFNAIAYAYNVRVLSCSAKNFIPHKTANYIAGNCQLLCCM